jgi:hypothetical protein
MTSYPLKKSKGRKILFRGHLRCVVSLGTLKADENKFGVSEMGKKTSTPFLFKTLLPWSTKKEGLDKLVFHFMSNKAQWEKTNKISFLSSMYLCMYYVLIHEPFHVHIITYRVQSYIIRKENANGNSILTMYIKCKTMIPTGFCTNTELEI